MITITTMTPHDNILIISSITNDIDSISVVLLVVKGTLMSLYTGVKKILVIMAFVNCVPVFNDIDDVISVYILVLVLSSPVTL